MSPITEDDRSNVSSISDESLSESSQSAIELSRNHDISSTSLWLPTYTSNSTRGSFGFKVIGDNLDSTVRPRYMRKFGGFKTQSLHLFHAYAVQDRIDISNFCDIPLPTCLNSPENLAISLLPTKEDDDITKKNFTCLFSRILVESCPFFETMFQESRYYCESHPL